jgi:hypothetical protein
MKPECIPLWVDILNTPTVAAISAGIFTLLAQIKFDIFKRKRPVLRNFYFSTAHDGSNSKVDFTRQKGYFIFDCFCEGKNITDVYYKAKLMFRPNTQEKWNKLKKEDKQYSDDSRLLKTKNVNHSAVFQTSENSIFSLDALDEKNYDILTLLYESMIVYAHIKDSHGRRSNTLKRKIIFINDSELKSC